MHAIVPINWIDTFFAKVWGATDNEDDQLGNAFGAAGKIMIGATALQTKDPVKIARFVGWPLPYVSAVLWNLDRNTSWITKAYSELTLLMASTPIDEAELKDAIGWATEEFWEVDQPCRINLVAL
jgi:hypothetical protein